MISVAAETVFHLGSFPVTNSIINAWIAIGLFFVLGLYVKTRATVAPRGFMNAIDVTVTGLLAEVEKITGDARRARQFFPIVASLFFLILVSNWMGLLPGVGSIGVYEMIHGERELVPLFRPVTSDLNFTLAIALFSVLASHVFGLFAVGVLAHIGKFIKIADIIRAFKHGPMAVVIALVEFGVGLLEIVSEIAKTLSLSLRLFGNVFAGEVLLTVIYGLVSYVVPLPFVFLELLVGIIQATVFAMLTLVFLTSMTAPMESHADSHS